MGELDCKSLGLKVGLEIHQQLEKNKLFCSCQCEFSESVVKRFERILRPSQSEMGEIDKAALEEAQKSLVITYESTHFDCLVEADEEPPHSANPEAVKTTLLLAKMVGAIPIDEIQFMRKIVIDGSNTAGFQRTALVAIKGNMDVNGKNIGIETICLEEDAARRISEEGSKVVFRLDRLGIPLIEIATAPDISNPEEARKVAERIGTLLRATHRVKRGIGSIREDLNISISGGARVEIKGVQELAMLPSYIEIEMRRQIALIAVKEELARRGIKEILGEKVDITKIFTKTASKVIAKSVSKGEAVLAVRLPGFDALMCPDDQGTKRIGREMALHAKVAGVGGIFHSDELPGYGITEDEVQEIRRTLKAFKPDGFAMVAAPNEKASAAIERVIVRARQALIGVPEETRDPLPDGTTAYSRPLPGRARMYPETDVPPIPVSKQLLNDVAQLIPELPEEIVHRLQKLYSLSEEQATALVGNGDDEEFEEMVKIGISPKLAARTMINTLSELKSEGLDIKSLDRQSMKEVLLRVEKGFFSKEAVPELLKRMLEHCESVDDACTKLGMKQASDSDLDCVIDRLIVEKQDLIEEKGERAIAPLMGLLMEELRGKVDGQVLNKKLTYKVKEALGQK